MKGKSYSEIGRLEDLTKTTVATIIQRTKKRTGQDRFTNAPRCGAPKKLKVRGERRLLRAASNDTRATLAVLGTPSKSGKELSRKLVRKTLKKYSKAQRHARRKPYLSKTHQKGRYRWGKKEKGRN
jgi:transposase